MAKLTSFAAAAVAWALLAACSDSDSALVAPAAAAAPSTAPSTAPSATPGDGPSQPVGDGTAWAYVLSDPAGTPTEVGVRMSGASLSGLSTEDHGMHPMPTVLTFPSGANSGVLNHVELYWNPTGHEPPGIWDKPHFDFHFYLTDEAAVRAIDPASPDFATKAAVLPDAKYMPVDFVTPPGTPVTNTIPGMGLHWSDSTESLVPGTYNFTETMINGSYDGTHTFIEPMITREWLLGRPTLDKALKQPQTYQRSGLYPTRYKVRYDAARDEYTVALGGFIEQAAS